MKSRIFILSGILAAQLLLAGVLNLTGEEYGAFQAEDKLLSFDKQAVSDLRIEDGTDSVVLEKQEGQWLLPESGDFPASQRDVGNLLDNLAALQKGWPVARTRAAARRFSGGGAVPLLRRRRGPNAPTGNDRGQGGPHQIFHSTFQFLNSRRRVSASGLLPPVRSENRPRAGFGCEAAWGLAASDRLAITFGAG